MRTILPFPTLVKYRRAVVLFRRVVVLLSAVALAVSR